MDKVVLDRINAAFDKVIDDFKKDENSIFPDDKTRTKLKYENAKHILEAWDKSKYCIYKGCKEMSIPRSHSIQKSSSLKLIAENGHVTTMKFDTKAEKVVATKVGVNIASTFPGFCETHEKLFSNFETAKDIGAAEDFTLQFYRTVCMEIVSKKYYIDVLEERKRQYLAFRDKRIGELICNELGQDLISHHKFDLKTLKFKYRDYRMNQLEERIKNLRNGLHGFLRAYQAGILHDVKTKTNRKICSNIFVLDMELPVCLAGQGNFQVSRKSKTRNVDLILNVLPYPGKTFIAASALSNYNTELDYYLTFACICRR